MKWIIVVMGLLHPNLTQIYPSLPPFVPNHQNGCIGHFDNIQHSQEQVLAINFTDSMEIDSFHYTCESYLDTLHCLDSILYVNYDTLTRNLRNAIAYDFSLVMQQHQGFFANLNANQQAVVPPLHSIPATACASQKYF